MMQAHGDIRLDWRGRILRVETSGLFNEEGALAASARYQQTVCDAEDAPWARLDIWQSGVLGTPEVFAHAPEVYRWSAEHGCRAIAIVAGDQMQRELMDGLIPAPFAFFAEEALALSWLEQQLTETQHTEAALA